MENKKELTDKNDGCTSSTFDSRDAFVDDFQNVKNIYDFKKLMDEMNALSLEYSAKIKDAIEKRKNWVINHEYENPCTIWLKTSDVTKNYPICSNTLRKHRNNKRIPSTFQDGKYLFKKEDIEAFFEENYNGNKKIKNKVA